MQLNQQLVIPKAFHTVAVGDYLSVLARDYNTTATAIREANHLASNQVGVGQTLSIPTNGGGKSGSNVQTIDSVYSVVSGDSLSIIAKRFGTTVDALLSANGLKSDVLCFTNWTADGDPMRQHYAHTTIQSGT